MQIGTQKHTHTQARTQATLSTSNGANVPLRLECKFELVRACVARSITQKRSEVSFHFINIIFRRRVLFLRLPASCPPCFELHCISFHFIICIFYVFYILYNMLRNVCYVFICLCTNAPPPPLPPPKMPFGIGWLTSFLTSAQ